jgi:DNA polymerase-3 subunit delta
MRISPEQLQQHLARELKPLYTVFGDETLLALEAADRIRARARAEGYTERNVLTADSGFKWSELAFTGSSQSLFAARRVLELRVPSGKPGTDGSAALQAYCESPPPDTITLVTLPGVEWRAQKAGWFEALDRCGVSVEAKPVTRKALPEWLAGRLKAQGQEADKVTLEFIADRVEGNLLAAHQELQKLALLHPPGILTFEQVEAAVLNVARYDVFKLGEAVLAGQPQRALRMLEGLEAEGEAPVLVHWTLAEDIRSLKRIHDAMQGGKPLPMALKEARIWGAKERLYERVLPLLADHELAHLVMAASVCDGVIKGLKHPDWPQDAWSALKRLVLLMLQPVTSAPAPARSATAHGAARLQLALMA